MVTTGTADTKAWSKGSLAKTGWDIEVGRWLKLEKQQKGVPCGLDTSTMPPLDMNATLTLPQPNVPPNAHKRTRSVNVHMPDPNE